MGGACQHSTNQRVSVALYYNTSVVLSCLRGGWGVGGNGRRGNNVEGEGTEVTNGGEKNRVGGEWRERRMEGEQRENRRRENGGEGNGVGGEVMQGERRMNGELGRGECRGKNNGGRVRRIEQRGMERVW